MKKIYLFIIQGHICCQVTDEYGISTLRAKAVYDYLISYGITPGRLSYKGYGSTQPLYQLPESDEEQRVANRRVEIKVVAN